MPIRINLLAEQQAAEEARRRDPVKRAVWIGGFVVAAVLIWIGYGQLKLSRVKYELSGHEAHWKRIQPAFLQVSNDFRETAFIRQKLESLQRYSTNRFLWANVLNSLQHTTNDRIRVVNLTGNISLTEQKRILKSTNAMVALAPKSWWKWSSEPPKTDIRDLVKATLASITNDSALLPYHSQLVISPVNITTNPIQIFAPIEVIKPETVSERISLTLRARDYSVLPEKRMDEFNRSITNAPYFKQFLGKTNSAVQPELLQPKEDATDSISPGQLYIPFVVEFFFPERIRSND
jgi:hypothetical protein